MLRGDTRLWRRLPMYAYVRMHIYVCVRVCVKVCEKERVRKRESICVYVWKRERANIEETVQKRALKNRFDRRSVKETTSTYLSRIAVKA